MLNRPTGAPSMSADRPATILCMDDNEADLPQEVLNRVDRRVRKDTSRIAFLTALQELPSAEKRNEPTTEPCAGRLAKPTKP